MHILKKLKLFSLTTVFMMVFQMLYPVLAIGATSFSVSAEEDPSETPQVQEVQPDEEEPECTEGSNWVSSVMNFTQGLRTDGSPVLPERSDATKALHAADGEFVSLGFGGTIDLMFPNPVIDTDGDDISFHEVTGGTYPEEKVEVFVGQDLGDMRFVGIVTNGPSVQYLDFSSTGLPWIMNVRIVDQSDPSLFTNKLDADGYDLDAVDGVYGICEELEPEPEVGEIEVCKYYDQNANGVWDEGEMGLEGWTVNVKGKKVKLEAQTELDGCVYFEDLPLQAYEVTEENREGWIRTTSKKIEISLGEQEGYAEFGNHVWQPKPGSISGFKYEDVNGNGKFDKGEPKLPNWKIKAEHDGPAIVDYLYVYPDGNTYASNITTKLDDDYMIKVYGNYNYWPDELGNGAGIADASYSLRPDEGWVVGDNLPAPWEGYLEVKVDGMNVDWGSFNPNHEYEYMTKGTGDPFEFSIMDSNYADNSGFLKVVIYKKNFSVSMKTDSNGDYMFENIPVGMYEVTEKLKKGWTQTEMAGTVKVKEGKKTKNVRFGNYYPGTISGYKFEDMNMNGVDDDESRLANWEIILMKGRQEVGRMMTGDLGEFKFTNLDAGEYYVCETQLKGWTSTTGMDSNPDCMGPYLVESQTEINDVAVGNYMYGRITVFKFDDLNGNGKQDEGEPGVDNWPIRVSRNGGDPVLMHTGSDGYLVLENLNPFSITIAEGMLEGWKQTSPENSFTFDIESGSDEYAVFGNFKLVPVGAHKFEDTNGNGRMDNGERGIPGWRIYLRLHDGTIIDRVTDGRGNAFFGAFETGKYQMWEGSRPSWVKTMPTDPGYQFMITTSGQRPMMYNFGNFKLSSISGHKYVDNNANGKYEPRIDSPKEGWRIKLFKFERGDWRLVDTEFTLRDGSYEFENVGPGRYEIREEYRPGWTNTNQSVYRNIVKLSGRNQGQFNFFNFKLGKVSGIKFEDRNGNGTKQLFEPKVSRWTINLYGPTDNPRVSPNLRTVTTNVNGRYEFTELPYGTYVLLEGMRPGWSQTRPMVVTGLPGYALKVDRSGAHVTKSLEGHNLNFGNIKNAHISGYKYEDMNGNGIRDREDVPLEGWEINLCMEVMPTRATSEAEVFSIDQVGDLPLVQEYKDLNICRMVTTGPDGYYEFKSVPYGTYRLTENLKKGWTQTNAPRERVEINKSRMRLKNQNFFNFDNVDLTVKKFEDSNMNGVWDKGEEGVSDWTVGLVGPDGVKRKTTGPDGSVMYTNLGPGKYELREDDNGPNGNWVQTVPMMDSGMNYYTGQARSGMDVERVFGNYEYGMIDGYKIEDIDGDGNLTRQEPRLSGWTINLWRIGEFGRELVDTTVTDEEGYYKFEGLTPDDYYVAEEMQDGWMATVGSPSYGPLAVESGSKYHGKNFGNFKLGKVSGYKWEDINRDHIWQEGEPTIEGWEMRLCLLEMPSGKLDDGDNPPGQTVDENGMGCKESWTMLTDANGYFEFVDLGPGSYVLMEDESDITWTKTWPEEPGYKIMIISGSVYGDREECMYMSGNLEDGVHQAEAFESEIKPMPIMMECPNFGNYELGMIQGRKYNDVNKNGDFDQEEKQEDGNPNRMDGWKINLYNSDWKMVDWMMTGDDETAAGKVGKGQYRFVGLEPDTYYVCEEGQEKWTQTEPSPEKGVYNEELGTYCFEVKIKKKSGQRKTGRQFGNYEMYPDLYVEISDGDPLFVNPGDTITYTLSYGNIGEYSADNVELEKTVPNDTTADLGNSTPGWVCMPGVTETSVCTLDVGTLDVGDTGVATLAVIVDPTLTEDTTIIDPAKISYNNGTGVEVTYANNEATDSTEVRVPEELGVMTDNVVEKVGEVLGATGDNLLYVIVGFALTVLLGGSALYVYNKKRK